MTTDPADHLVAAPPGSPVLGYRPAGAAAPQARGRHWATAAFLWSFLSPFTVAAVLLFIVEGVIDIDDLLPRNGALAVIGAVGMGVPFAGVLAGGGAFTRATTRSQKWLAAGAIAFGGLWSVSAFVLFVFLVSHT